MSKKVVPITAAPVRRSGFTNTAPPHLQSVFIDAARAAMGQPGVEEAAWCLGKLVKISFNFERKPVIGVVTRIIRHPASGLSATYIVLDKDEKVRYPLNSIESIELMPGPNVTVELPSGETRKVEGVWRTRDDD